MTEWWTAQEAGMIGAIGGTLAGVLGGTLGPAIGVCAPRGIARRPIMGAMFGTIGLGLALLVAGVTALAMGQPYHVWFPLLLGGGLLGAIFGSLLPVVRARYAQAEARRLDAEMLRRT